MSEQAITGKRRAERAPVAPRSLRTRLLLFTTFLVLVPGILLALIAERSGSTSLQQIIGGQLAREAGHTADRLSSVVRGERDTLVSFAQQDLMREIRVADIDKRISVALATLRDGGAARLEYLVLDRPLVFFRLEDLESSWPTTDRDCRRNPLGMRTGGAAGPAWVSRP